MITSPPEVDEVRQLPIDPRMRQRRVEVEQAVGRRRLHILMAIGGALGLAALTLVALHTPLVSVRHARVGGVHHETQAAVLTAAGITKGEPLADISPAGAEVGIERLPWVASASVKRSWPSSVMIRVVERQVVAQVPTGGSTSGPVVEVDATGRVLQVRSSPLPGLPLVTGAGAAGQPGSWLAGSSGPTAGAGRGAVSAELADPTSPVAGALGLAASLVSSGLGPRAGGVGPAHAWVGRVEVLTGGTLSALAQPSKATLVLGPDTELRAKLAAMIALLSDVRIGGGKTVDLTVPNRPTIGSPAPAPSTGAGGPSSRPGFPAG